MIYAIVAAVVLVLAFSERVETDGPDAQGYSWERSGPVGEPVVHYGADVFLHCGLETNAKSCSRIEDGRCDVYVPVNAEAWLIPHEERHCAGWVHPGGLHW